MLDEARKARYRHVAESREICGRKWVREGMEIVRKDKKIVVAVTAMYMYSCLEEVFDKIQTSRPGRSLP